MLCDMSVITFRTDDEVDRALAELSEADGDRSQVIREAILSAWRARHRAAVRAEAQVLAADADDVAEMREVLADLEPLRAW